MRQDAQCHDADSNPDFIRYVQTVSDYSSYMWSVPDWRTDETYSMLDNREQGIYRNLIDECWVSGSITSDPEILARFVREPLDYFALVWAKIRPKFASIDKGLRLISPRLEKDRGRLQGIRKQRVAAGAKGNSEKRRRREAAANAKGFHTLEQWKALCVLADFRCVRCGIQPDGLQKDHIVPLYQGGSNGIDNIQPVCQKCNSQKGSESIDHRSFDWQQLADTLLVSRICERFANAFASVLRTRETRQTQTQTQGSITLPLKDPLKLIHNSLPEDGPASKTGRADLAADWFADRCLELTGSPYVSEAGDFVQLARLRKGFKLPSRDKPPGWDDAVTNYFASPLSQYSLADLANPKRYAVFKNSPLNEFKVPVNHQKAQGESHEQRKERVRQENLQSVLSRIAESGEPSLKPGTERGANGDLHRIAGKSQ